MTDRGSTQAPLTLGGTTLRAASDAELPVGLAKPFAVVEWLFNSSVCQILLPLLPPKCWSRKYSSKNLQMQIYVSGSFSWETLRLHSCKDVVQSP